MRGYRTIYCQITTACNMHCPHCCYDAQYHGEHMEIDTFKKVLEFTKDLSLNIGGGEPTVHPQFFSILDLAIEARREWKISKIWMVINGKRKEHALKVAEIASTGIIKCGLSLDEWHEPISQEVQDAWTGIRSHKDGRFIQNVGRRSLPLRHGRWDKEGRTACNCPKPFIMPNGNIYQCGCKGAPQIGNVFDGCDPLPDKRPGIRTHPKGEKRAGLP